jgi:hypothetical protein
MRIDAYRLIAIASIFVLSACRGNSLEGSKIEVVNAWVRALGAPGGHAMTDEEHGDESGATITPSIGDITAAYMTLRNLGNEGDRLLSARSDIAQTVELHISEMENGVMQMRPVPYIEVPAKGEVELKPGGYHMMLIGLTRTLSPGEKATLILIFEKAGEITIESEVRAP